MSTFNAAVNSPPCNSTTITVDEMETFIQCTSFSDRHMVVISQTGNFGTWINAYCEECSNGKLLFQTKTILGERENELINIYARQIIEKICLSESNGALHRDFKPLVLSISLNKACKSAKSMEQILNALFAINTWQ